MSARGAGLVLGTAQFGLPYGIAGRGEIVPEAEVREILELAARHRVRALDTAPGYGDIEARLPALCAGLALSVISKIPPAPTAGAAAAIRTSVERSRSLLEGRLTTLLFHRADDLFRRDADTLWRAATDAADHVGVGVSCYDPARAVALRERFGIRVAQVPANALDQRLRALRPEETLPGVELHARSVFLQGLLLMPASRALLRAPAATGALARWTAWCRDHELQPVPAALGIARGLPGVRYCVVGVDRVAQLQEILNSADVTVPVDASALGCDNPDVIDPRRWTAA